MSTIRAVVDREFHTPVEACIDIAGRLLGTTDATMPGTYAERFQVLEERDILSRETVGCNRRPVPERAGHRYGAEVDDRLVYEHSPSELEWIVTFLQKIRNYLAEP